MEDEELKELLKIDFPEIKADENKVLAVCKARNTKYNKQLMKLTYVLSSFVVLAIVAVLSIVLLNDRIPTGVTNPNDKIEIVRSSTYTINGHEGLDSKWIVGTYGVEVLVQFDFTKHPKYDEWVEECRPLALEKMDKEMAEYGYYRYSYEVYLTEQILVKYYETIKNTFTGATEYSLLPFDGGSIFLGYLVLPVENETIEDAIKNSNNYFEDYLKSNDYNNLLKLANSDYVCDITISQMDVSLQGEE